MNDPNLDLRERARALHAQIASWEDDRQRTDRRRAEVQAEVDELDKRLQISEESIARLDDKIAAARDEVTRINRLVPQDVAKPPPPAAAPEREVKTDAVRAGILRFREGSVAELAAYLRLTPKQVHEALQAEVAMKVIRFTGGKFGGSPLWEYVPPTDPGAAFRIQQESRAAEADDPSYSFEVENASVGYLQALPKDVRKVARDAIKAGWILTPAGSGHYRLTFGERVVSISATPQSQSAEARMLRRRINGTGMTTTRRGSPVAGTGKPIGSSGKPGLDKARAGAGKRVYRKGKRTM